jgi:hypothetical protein
MTPTPPPVWPDDLPLSRDEPPVLRAQWRAPYHGVAEFAP